jgi:hypothetical protein
MMDGGAGLVSISIGTASSDISTLRACHLSRECATHRAISRLREWARSIDSEQEMSLKRLLTSIFAKWPYQEGLL